MRILIVHNSYGSSSGEEAVVAEQIKLLADNGHAVLLFERSSAEIPSMKLGKLRAFFSGIYSFSSHRQIRKLLSRNKPDIAHVHNVFPLISPSVLAEFKKQRIPVVMTVHNYRLVCPNGLHMPKGKLTVCEACCGGKEYWCFLKNCENNIFKSLGYAIRNSVARRHAFFRKNVTVYTCLTEFQRKRLIDQDYSPDRLVVVPNFRPMTDRTHKAKTTGNSVLFIGRVSPEKGIEDLIEAARLLPNIHFDVVGSHDAMRGISKMVPKNVTLHGSVPSNQVQRFYSNSRITVLPSICFEGFPMVLLEAMMNVRPVVASRIGGIPEIVEEGRIGLLFEPGNSKELAQKIKYLWDNPALCHQMGERARQKAIQAYSSEQHYKKLLRVYENAMQLSAKGFAL